MLSTDTNTLDCHSSRDSTSGFYMRQTSGRIRRGWQRIGVMMALILFIGSGVDFTRADDGKPAAGVSGLIGAINPETGQIGPPTAEQLQHLRANLQRLYAAKITPRAPVKLPNGATMAVPGPETLSFVVTRLNSDDTLSTICVSNIQDAVRFWSTPGTPPPHAHQQENHPPTLNVTFPEEISGLYAATAASFGPPVTHMGTEGVIELADDGVPPGTDACEALQNSFEGRMALIDRGNCMFTDKVANAEAAGASAVILVNNVPGPPIGVGGNAPEILIPSIMISQSDGALIRAVQNVRVILQFDDTRLSGADDNGSVRLFAPNPLQPGSSVSHWDSSANPNLLMEPHITPDLAPLRDVDLTLALLADIGWIVPTSNGVMTLSPPSGTYLATQTIDLSVVIDTPEPSIESLQALLNEADVTDNIGSCLMANSGMLATGGLSLRCPNVNSSIAAGTANLTLAIRLVDGSRHTAAVTWTVLSNEE